MRIRTKARQRFVEVTPRGRGDRSDEPDRNGESGRGLGHRPHATRQVRRPVEDCEHPLAIASAEELALFLDLRPAIAKSHRAVEHGLSRRTGLVGTEVPEPLELIARQGLRTSQ